MHIAFARISQVTKTFALVLTRSRSFSHVLARSCSFLPLMPVMCTRCFVRRTMARKEALFSSRLYLVKSRMHSARYCVEFHSMNASRLTRFLIRLINTLRTIHSRFVAVADASYVITAG